jgi:hypothetical protein
MGLSRKEAAVFWVIRWTDQHSGQDKSIVVEAESQAEAEYMGLKRGIPIVFLGEASDADISDAKRAKLLWKYSRVSPYSCFGRAMTTREVVFVMTCGIATALLNLRPVIEQLQGQMF